MKDIITSKITKRSDGRYSAYCRMNDDKKRHYVYGSTPAECRMALSDMAIKLEQGYTGSRCTFGQFAEKWLRSKEGILSPTTMNRYSQDLARHILPKLKDKRLDKISASDIQSLITEYGQTHSEKSSSAIRGLIHTILDNARINRIIPYNPCEGIQLVPTAPHEYKIYTDEQMQDLFDTLGDDPHRPTLLLIAYCGLRPSEALALKWEDIDFEAETLTVRRSVVSVNQKPVLKELQKTKESRATTYVPGAVLAELKRYRGIGYIRTTNGMPQSPGTFSEWFQRFLKRNKLPRTRLYDLRHYTATTLMDAGLPDKVISQYMRHTNIAMTRHYQHAREEARKKAASALGKVIEFKAAK